MLKGILKRVREDDAGFTLIELMVVVLIIGILVAIALPTFLGARNRANDKAAESSLRNGIAAAKTIFTDTDDYSTVDAASLKLTEPSLNFVDDPAQATGPTDVSVAVATSAGGTANDTVDMASLSKSGTCFYLEDISGSGTTFGSGPSTACAGGDAAGANNGW